MEDKIICEGHLKQQTTDEYGLYNWSENFYRLDCRSGELEISNDVSGVTKLSLKGSKFAKKWSMSSSAIGGYGFDIVWSSGRIWSFLASDEDTCRMWIENINKCISGKENTNNSINLSQNLSKSTEDTFVQSHAPLPKTPSRQLYEGEIDNTKTTNIFGLKSNKRSDDNYIDSSSNISSIPHFTSSSSEGSPPDQGKKQVPKNQTREMEDVNSRTVVIEKVNSPSNSPKRKKNSVSSLKSPKKSASKEEVKPDITEEDDVAGQTQQISSAKMTSISEAAINDQSFPDRTTDNFSFEPVFQDRDVSALIKR
jgi:hypothetical protein